MLAFASDLDVTTPLAITAARPRPRRGYDAGWWGDVGRSRPDRFDYWQRTRTPLAALWLVLPALAAYEVGVAVVGGANPNACRTGIDGWVRLALASFGLTDRWLPPLALACGLLAWHAADRARVPFRPRPAPHTLPAPATKKAERGEGPGYPLGARPRGQPETPNLHRLAATEMRYGAISAIAASNASTSASVPTVIRSASNRSGVAK